MEAIIYCKIIKNVTKLSLNHTNVALAAHRHIVGGGGAVIIKNWQRRRPQIVAGGGHGQLGAQHEVDINIHVHVHALCGKLVLSTLLFFQIGW